MTDTPWTRPRLAVRLKPAAMRQVRRGHPWIFDQSITSISADGQPGDLAVVFDDKRKFAAVGLYDPASPIRIRVLHTGKPLTIDDGWLTATVAAANERRRSLIEREDTTALRIIHGENDGLGGLVADLYNRHLVVKVYSAAWLPWLSALKDSFMAALADEVDSILIRAGRNVQDPSASPDVLHGSTPDKQVDVLENGLTFSVDLLRGHKTGHFLDQRANRALIREHCEGRSVLDVFSSTGGFAVHAAAGGATSIVAVDVSGPALDQARVNMTANGFESVEPFFKTVKGDAFDKLDEMTDRGVVFDIVVIDPPSMASRQTQVAGALAAYQRLAQLGGRLAAPGGLLYLASCTARVSVEDFVTASYRGLELAARTPTVLAETGHDVDHPISFDQGRYLKGILLSL